MIVHFAVILLLGISDCALRVCRQVWTYMWSVPLGLSAWQRGKAVNLAVIGAGVAVAAMGAVEGTPLGMTIQLVGIIIEAAR